MTARYMERTAKTMRERHAREFAEMQSRCKHKKTSWIASMWAPGHLEGKVKICDVCEKILLRKTMKMPKTVTVSSAPNLGIKWIDITNKGK